MKYEYPEETKDISVIDNKILVDTMQDEEKTTRGLILTNKSVASKTYKRGIVLKSGSGLWNSDKTKRISNECEVGDIILYQQDKGLEVSINNKTFVSLTEPEGIIGKVGEVNNGEIELYVDIGI